MQSAASGTSTGNKNISHFHSTPVTVQMGSPGREAVRAMKKDEQSERGSGTREQDKEKHEIIFFLLRLLKQIEEEVKRVNETAGMRQQCVFVNNVLKGLCFFSGSSAKLDVPQQSTFSKL